MERTQRRQARQSASSGKRKPARRIALSPRLGALAVIVCALPVLGGLVAPLGRLGWRALNAPIAREIVSAAQNSLMLALLSGIVAAGIGLSAAYALRSGRPTAIAAARLAGLGYAVPGSVAALGVLVLLGSLQRGVDSFWLDVFDVTFPMAFTGGILALVFAYQSRFAAAAMGPSESALSRVTPTLDGASRTLGASALETAWRVHWPLIASGILLAGLLVFVEVLKELPATMILRPFNFETLAVTAHNYASDERLGEAALPALLIALIALPPMIWIARRLTRSEVAR